MSPGAIDRAVLRRHLAALEGACRNLDRRRGIERAALEQRSDERWIVERGLQLCAQNALDIATHIVAAEGQEAGDYAGAVDRLAMLGVIPHDFARRFRGVAGFRNVLVHAYLEVDLDVLVRALSEGLDDFRAFAQHVEIWLAQPGSDERRNGESETT